MSNGLRSFVAYVATLLVFVLLDVAWLMLVAVGMFQSQIGEILKPQPDLGAAAALYLIFAAGLLVLAVRPGIERKSLGKSVLNGAVLGLTAYATFDLTNLAVIKGWTLGITLVDMAWGTVLSATAAAAGYLAGSRLR